MIEYLQEKYVSSKPYNVKWNYMTKTWMRELLVDTKYAFQYLASLKKF